MVEKMKPDILNYLKSWSSGLSAKADQVRNLIGDAHWLTDGQHKEEILKAHLGAYLPKTLRITRGFVIDPLRENAISGEIDILITDATRTAPLLVENDLTICMPSAVIGHIEVKTTFDQATCDKALSSSTKNQSIVSLASKGKNAWSAIFFYQLGKKTKSENATKIIIKSIQKLISKDNNLKISHDSALNLPKVIILMGVCVAFISCSSSKNLVKVKVFYIQDLSAAIGIFDFYAMVSETLHFEGFLDIEQLMQYIGGSNPKIEEIKID